ncbi:DnaJ-domain-containing protein [Neolentinus lepideus HHB14362 ss-1]|uniref:DnaJ-domain-containing protein n=1 Tax=Neolentinus lepideus HHB14362 ss-1 TaxID=1314782 RepID=A0A165T6I3_9AGAM|nr:DnaJ-domain-containing protein [Neolentinus lepideus HHB14362 ss-1]
MDDREDPASQFFPGEESPDLYAALELQPDVKADDIKKAYRRLALRYHPDKHSGSAESVKAGASLKFQKIGFAYSVLSDEKKRERYDRTGRTDEGFDLGDGEGGWEAYFEELFDRVTKGKLDEMKHEYQGSSEENEDLKTAYHETGGDINEIMNHIPHCTHEDEPRFIVLISELISKGDLPELPTWKKSIQDEKAKVVRKKQADKEAAEAEELAKDLGVWDEFYGSGETGPRKTKSKGKGKQKDRDAEAGDDEDVSALQALILKKRKNMDNFFDTLADKYSEHEGKSKGKGKGRKRGKVANDDEDVDASPRKKSKKCVPPPPDIDDEEFEKLQQKLFGEKPKPTADSGGKADKPKRAAKSRKAR